jgi:hypothetical protein
MAGLWRRRQYPMRFFLGGLPAGRVVVPALVLDTHFSELDPDPTASQPPLEQLGPGLDLVLLPSHPVTAAPPRFERLDSCVRYVPRCYRRHFIDLRVGLEAYLAGFSSRSRSTLRRKLRRFTSLPGTALREYHAPAQMDEFFALARALSRKTYQEALYDKGLPASDGFRRQLRQLAAEDRVRAYILLLEDRPVAYLYCPVEDGVLLYQHLGYDPAAAPLSPGTVLQQLALERLFAEGRFRMFDFTEGEGAHKEQFASGSVLCADLHYFRLTARNLALVGLHTATAAASRQGMALLRRAGIGDRLRRFVRRRAADRDAELESLDAAAAPSLRSSGVRGV